MVLDDTATIPADPAAEQALLGAILLQPPVIDQVDFITPGDFYHGMYGEIFRRMRQLWDDGEPLDPVLIADGDVELYAACSDAFASCPSHLHAHAYARKVKALAQKRHFISVANTLMGYATNGTTPDAIADYLREAIETQTALGTANPFDRWREQGITAAAAANTGVIERYYLVQDIIRALSLSIFFGPPGVLKTVLLMDLALCIASGTPWLQRLPVDGNDQREFATRQTRVLWLNYDQSHDDVIERLGAMARVYDGGENVTAISHSTPPAVLETERQARALGKWCAREGYGVVIVDCLLDVKGKADLQEASMGDVLRLWRLVAEVGDCCVIIISHSTKVTADLYGSQFIKAKVDHLYRVSRPAGTDIAVIESEKQRSFGETGKLYARWTWTHFEDTRTLKTARFFGDAHDQRAAHPNNTTQHAILNVLMASPGRGFSVADLTAILNEDRDQDAQVSQAAVRKAANRLADNERSVGKAETDDGNIYHFGSLTATA